MLSQLQCLSAYCNKIDALQPNILARGQHVGFKNVMEAYHQRVCHREAALGIRVHHLYRLAIGGCQDIPWHHGSLIDHILVRDA
jgi:hypothetical protein